MDAEDEPTMTSEPEIQSIPETRRKIPKYELNLRLAKEIIGISEKYEGGGEYVHERLSEILADMEESFIPTSALLIPKEATRKPSGTGT